MRTTYHAIIDFKNSNPPKIKKISVPDLDIVLSGKEIAENKLEQICPQVTKFIEQQLEQRIKDIYNENQIIPEPRFDVTTLKENQIALEITVKAEEIRKGCFARFFVGTGLAFSAGSALSGIVINMVQMRLAMGEDQNSKSSIALPILQAVLNNSVGMLFYVYLKSDQGLEKIGIKLDNFLKNKKCAFEFNTKSTSFFLMKLLMMGGAIGLQLGNATAQMGGLNAIENESNQAGHALIPAYYFNIAKWTFNICFNTVGLIMTTTILGQLSQDIQNYVTRRETLNSANAIATLREENVEYAHDLKEIHGVDDMKNANHFDLAMKNRA